jgi:hypothetical protein
VPPLLRRHPRHRAERQSNEVYCRNCVRSVPRLYRSLRPGSLGAGRPGGSHRRRLARNLGRLGRSCPQRHSDCSPRPILTISTGFPSGRSWAFSTTTANAWSGDSTSPRPLASITNGIRRPRSGRPFLAVRPVPVSASMRMPMNSRYRGYPSGVCGPPPGSNRVPRPSSRKKRALKA